MNAPIDTLAFAEKFEGAGFGHDQARALAAAFGQAHEAGREDLVTKDYLKGELSILRTELLQAIAEQRIALTNAMAEQRVSLTNAIAENGRDISGRLWSTVTIIAGVSTAISAVVGAEVALILHAKGM